MREEKVCGYCGKRSFASPCEDCYAIQFQIQKNPRVATRFILEMAPGAEPVEALKAKLVPYAFTDSHGHPLESCLDYMKLLDAADENRWRERWVTFKAILMAMKELASADNATIDNDAGLQVFQAVLEEADKLEVMEGATGPLETSLKWRTLALASAVMDMNEGRANHFLEQVNDDDGDSMLEHLAMISHLLECHLGYSLGCSDIPGDDERAATRKMATALVRHQFMDGFDMVNIILSQIETRERGQAIRAGLERLVGLLSATKYLPKKDGEEDHG
jgi:hypothetical protein